MAIKKVIKSKFLIFDSRDALKRSEEAARGGAASPPNYLP